MSAGTRESCCRVRQKGGEKKGKNTHTHTQRQHHALRVGDRRPDQQRTLNLLRDFVLLSHLQILSRTSYSTGMDSVLDQRKIKGSLTRYTVRTRRNTSLPQSKSGDDPQPTAMYPIKGPQSCNAEGTAASS